MQRCDAQLSYGNHPVKTGDRGSGKIRLLQRGRVASRDIVYIVDDDADVRASAAFLLQAAGVKCVSFSSADAFLQQVEDFYPGCILTDVRMPGLSGLELQTELQRRGIDWPLIVMTGHGDIPTAVQATKVGAYGFIEKPFSEGELLDALDQSFAALRKSLALRNQPIRSALQRNNVHPHYERQIDLRSGSIAGFEALLRWDRRVRADERGDAIHDAFEEAALGRSLSRCMLDHVVEDMRGWIERGVPFGHVAINASPCDFSDPSYADDLLAALADAGVPPKCLQVEITETVKMDPSDPLLLSMLDRLASAGIAIALDDFGTGFASMTHLHRLPVDIVKIDQSFVRTIGEERSASLVRGIVEFAQKLGQRVVAEGVQTPEQLSFLTRIGCDLAQGFYFGGSMPAGEVPEALTSPVVRERSSSPQSKETSQIVPFRIQGA
jgi:EAL domain-containing protein (putative c-di-GMP-specific phosphodiesterase class I)/CheY-like chemotaxis protein